MSKKILNETKTKRDIAVDRFRGIAILLVVVTILIGAFGDIVFDVIRNNTPGRDKAIATATFLSQYPLLAKLGTLFGHLKDGVILIENFNPLLTDRAGLSLADLFAPMFVFIVGLTYIKGFKSREEKVGTKKAYLHYASRFLGLIGIGALYAGYERFLEIVGGEVFTESDLFQKIFIVSLAIVILLVVASFVVKLFKNSKVTALTNNILRYSLAVIGMINLFFMLVNFSEKMGEWITNVDSVEAFGGSGWDWIQNIGLAGLVSLMFVKNDKHGRLIAVGVLLSIVTVLAQFGAHKLLTDKVDGGLMGVFGWTSILLFGTIFAEIKDNKKFYFGLALGLLAFGIYLALGPKFLITKRGVTSNYVMITSGLSALVYAGIGLLNNWKPKFAFFTWWGSNSMLTYILALIIGGLIYGIIALVGVMVPVWIMLSIVGVLLIGFTALNWFLSTKSKHIAL